MIADLELLRRYAEERSESAFAELVQRHVNLVYAAALRRVGGDAHLAEEVTQAVFTALARKAAALTHHPVLVGWLHRSTHFAALDALREKQRRGKREQPHDPMHANADLETDPRPEVKWEELRPVLDATLDQLNERDRGAVLLRFFEGRSFSQIGAALNVSEDAARMRVERALEKFRALLARRGITSTGTALGVVLSAQPMVAAPAGLAATVATAALASGGATTAGGLGALAFFTMSKIKVGLATAFLAAAFVPAVIEARANRALKGELAQVRAALHDTPQLRNDNRRLSAELGALSANRADAAELERLRRRAGVLKARPEGVVESEMKTATQWRNLGRSTPEAAYETFCHAVFVGDRDLVASFVRLSDDTAENRAAFLARFSDVVRARHGTPEKIVAAALFPGPPEKSPDDAHQILDVRPDRRAGEVRMRLWLRIGGREFEGGDRYVETSHGWALAPFPLGDERFRASIVARLDPRTGEPVRPGR